VDKERQFRNKKICKTYSITPQGVVALLQAHPESIKLSVDDVAKLAKKQVTFLPLIFGKWNYFSDKKLEKVASEFLLQAAKETHDEISQVEKAANGKIPRLWSGWMQESVHRHDIYEYMLVRAWNNGVFYSDSGQAWVAALRDDKELSDMFDKEVEMVSEDLKHNFLLRPTLS
jgi:hypothetical protein